MKYIKSVIIVSRIWEKGLVWRNEERDWLQKVVGASNKAFRTKGTSEGARKMERD